MLLQVNIKSIDATLVDDLSGCSLDSVCVCIEDIAFKLTDDETTEMQDMTASMKVGAQYQNSSVGSMAGLLQVCASNVL